jgi:L-amino acid N-acyltransferase YncA
MTLSIIRFEQAHWEAVSEIYFQGILTKQATFETIVPAYDAWISKFHTHHLWVAVANHEVIGWAGLQPVSARQVYNGVMENTIYVHKDHNGKGVGTTLMNHLILASEKAGIWTLYASIFPENISSKKLHINSGFREIGYRERIAKLDGVWRSTILFERRSTVVGN